jgi:RNA polymerase sigma-70 factor (ECF subfamily)
MSNLAVALRREKPGRYTLRSFLDLRLPFPEDPLMPSDPTAGTPSPSEPASSTVRSTTLLRQAQSGDRAALNQLVERYAPRLRAWASGRLPAFARQLLDTDDLVQEAMIRTVQRLQDLEFRHDLALQGYLRRAVMNRIRDEIRGARFRRPASDALGELPASEASPLEKVIGKDTFARYESALERLKPQERDAILARVELHADYDEIAEMLDKPSADAARMAVSRALLRLAEEMSDEG